MAYLRATGKYSFRQDWPVGAPGLEPRQLGRRLHGPELPKPNRKRYAWFRRASKNAVQKHITSREESMAITRRTLPVNRRALLQSGAAIAALQFSAPFIIKARGETPIRIGMVDPLTGVYAAIAQSEVVGAKYALEEINKKGGILGRPVELLVEDSANDVGTGVQKTRKLIERDQVSFIIGDVNSGIAIAMAQVTSEKKVLHIVSGRTHRSNYRHKLFVERVPGLQL